MSSRRAPQDNKSDKLDVKDVADVSSLLPFLGKLSLNRPSHSSELHYDDDFDIAAKRKGLIEKQTEKTIKLESESEREYRAKVIEILATEIENKWKTDNAVWIKYYGLLQSTDAASQKEQGIVIKGVQIKGNNHMFIPILPPGAKPVVKMPAHKKAPQDFEEKYKSFEEQFADMGWGADPTDEQVDAWIGNKKKNDKAFFDNDTWEKNAPPGWLPYYHPTLQQALKAPSMNFKNWPDADAAKTFPDNSEKMLNRYLVGCKRRDWNRDDGQYLLENTQSGIEDAWYRYLGKQTPTQRKAAKRARDKRSADKQNETPDTSTASDAGPSGTQPAPTPEAPVEIAPTPEAPPSMTNTPSSSDLPPKKRKPAGSYENPSDNAPADEEMPNAPAAAPADDAPAAAPADDAPAAAPADDAPAASSGDGGESSSSKTGKATKIPEILLENARSRIKIYQDRKKREEAEKRAKEDAQ